MPDIELLEVMPSDFYKNAEKVIYEGYRCNCQKYWREQDRFVVYKADKEGLAEIINSQIDKSNLATLLELSKYYTDSNVIISGGHTVVDLNDRFSISKEVEESVDFCLNYIVRSTTTLGIKPDFLMEINDFYMEKSDGDEIDGANNYRKKAISPYIIPEKVNQKILEIKENQKIQIKSFYVSEKNMADRFRRHIKNSLSDSSKFRKEGSSIWMLDKDTSFEVIKNNKPTCAAGNAATFRALRHKISSNKTFDNYTSHIGVFPLCSMKNVLNGYRAALSFYDLNLPSLLVFFGKSCFK